MQRSGAKRRSKNTLPAGERYTSSPNNSPFEMQASPSNVRKKRATRRHKVEDPSDDLPPTPSEMAPRRIKRVKKRKTKEVGAGEGRKIVRGTRRIVDKPSTPPMEETPVVALKKLSPKTKFTAKNTTPDEIKVIFDSPEVRVVNLRSRTSKKPSVNETDVIPPISAAFPRKAKHAQEIILQDSSTSTVNILNQTFDIDDLPGKADERYSRRSTFDVVDKDSFLAKKRQAGKKSVHVEEPARRSFDKPKEVPKRKFNVTLTNEKPKVKISESQTSLTESGLSSATKLMRRAQRMNPQEGTTPQLLKNRVSPRLNSQKKLPIVKSNTKVKKMPNYAAIHQKSYERMESIDKHMQRKAERAKALLSGQKVPVGTQNGGGISKKQLVFDSVAAKPLAMVGENKTPAVPLAKNTPPKLTMNKNGIAGRPIWGSSGKTAQKATPATTDTATSMTPSRSLRKRPFVQPPREKHISRIPLSRHNLLAKKVPAAVVVEAPKQVVKKADILTKCIKSTTTLSKGSSVTVDSRRDLIKGVRSNRRFDLLMSMRMQAK